MSSLVGTDLERSFVDPAVESDPVPMVESMIQFAGNRGENRRQVFLPVDHFSIDDRVFS